MGHLETVMLPCLFMIFILKQTEKKNLHKMCCFLVSLSCQNNPTECHPVCVGSLPFERNYSDMSHLTKILELHDVLLTPGIFAECLQMPLTGLLLRVFCCSVLISVPTLCYGADGLNPGQVSCPLWSAVTVNPGSAQWLTHRFWIVKEPKISKLRFDSHSCSVLFWFPDHIMFLLTDDIMLVPQIRQVLCVLGSGF